LDKGLGQIVPPATSSLFFHLGLHYLKGSKAIEAVCSTLHQFLTFSFISFQASFFVEQRPLCPLVRCLIAKKLADNVFLGREVKENIFSVSKRKCNKSLDLLTRWNLLPLRNGGKSNRILSSSTKRVNEPTNIQHLPANDCNVDQI
jgi:hypothetical protein